MLRLKPPREAKLEGRYVIKLAIMHRGARFPLSSALTLRKSSCRAACS
jgi:hypothetical protein